MKLKRITPLALSAFLLGTVAVGAEQPANTNQPAQNEETTEINNPASFVKMQGTIGAVEERKNQTFFSTTDENNPFNFTTDENTLVFDTKGNKVELKKGDKVSIYMHANQPMILIFPPQYSPAVVIVEDEKAVGSVKVGTFDKDFLSDNNDLKLNISDKTIIVNKKGEKVGKEALAENHAIVFYTFTTFSIPPQTSPEKIVVFPKVTNEIVTEEEGEEAAILEEAEVVGEGQENAANVEEAKEIDTKIVNLIGKDTREVDGKVMVPLRIVAEGLGFKVEAIKTGAIVSKGALSYTITRGEKMYGYNRALMQFEVAPALLEPGKTYVEYDFALQLLK